jgi:ACS family tartrate transporter-like MFS transporter
MTDSDAATSDLTGQAAIAAITRRLIPFLCLLFIVNYLDRTNIAMAKLRMLGDLNLSEDAYGTGAGLFFIGYFLFEVPSNLIMHRVGARRWIARIMISWGILSAAMLLTRGRASFYSLRFLLGLAEAGFFPGIVLYLSFWIPARQQAKVLSVFLTSTAVSGLVGNPLAGWLMQLEGFGGLHGWQWLFLAEGLLPLLLGIAILRFPLLPNRPADAPWLTLEQRHWIQHQLHSDGVAPQVNHVADLRAAAADPRLWLLCGIYFLLIMGLYGFIYWVPSIVKSLTGAADAKVGLLSAIPYLVATVSMVLIGAHADRTGQRRVHVAACALLAALGIVLLPASPGPVWGLVALCVAAIGIFGALGPFWAIPMRFLRGSAAAGGIAIINSAGALAGYPAPRVIGWSKTHTGHFTGGLLVIAASLAAGAVLVLCVPSAIDGGRRVD